MPEGLPVGWDITQVVTVVLVGAYALARFVWRDVQIMLSKRNGGTFENKTLTALETLTTEVQGMRSDLRHGFSARDQTDRLMQSELTSMAERATREIVEVVEQSASKLDVLLDRGR